MPPPLRHQSRDGAGAVVTMAVVDKGGIESVTRSSVVPLYPRAGCSIALQTHWGDLIRVVDYVRNAVRELFNVRNGQVLYTATGQLPPDKAPKDGKNLKATGDSKMSRL